MVALAVQEVGVHSSAAAGVAAAAAVAGREALLRRMEGRPPPRTGGDAEVVQEDHEVEEVLANVGRDGQQRVAGRPASVVGVGRGP